MPIIQTNTFGDDVPTPSTNKNTLFVEDDTYYHKDDQGVVRALGGGSSYPMMQIWSLMGADEFNMTRSQWYNRTDKGTYQLVSYDEYAGGLFVVAASGRYSIKIIADASLENGMSWPNADTMFGTVIDSSSFTALGRTRSNHTKTPTSGLTTSDQQYTSWIDEYIIDISEAAAFSVGVFTNIYNNPGAYINYELLMIIEKIADMPTQV